MWHPRLYGVYKVGNTAHPQALAGGDAPRLFLHKGGYIYHAPPYFLGVLSWPIASLPKPLCRSHFRSIQLPFLLVD